MYIPNDLEVKLNINQSTVKSINEKMKLRVRREIVSKGNNIYIIPKELFSDKKRVKDEIRYKISLPNIEFIGLAIKYNELHICDKYEKIVILLESPHRSEYDYSFNPIGPAQGVTGNNVEKFLKELCKDLKLEDNKQYLFILMNPIPWQCSLGSFYDDGLIPTLRNNIWSKLFNIYVEEFKAMINLYNPMIIINACTNGRKGRVMDAINDIPKLNNANKFYCYHPSCWHIKGIGLEEY